MKLSILIGAGASYGCGYKDLTKRPPLGRELYDELANIFPLSWGKFIPRTHISLFKSNFELGMTKLWMNQPDYLAKLLIDMSMYFTKFNPPVEENDLYTRLVQKIISNNLLMDTGFISLNYECVFEIAVSKRVNLNLSMNLDAPIKDNLLLWKPHGSCNFIPSVNVFNLTIVTSQPHQRYFAGPIRVLQLDDVRKLYSSPTPFAIPPAMSLYASTKPTLTSEDFIFQTRKSMKSWIDKSDYILVIGTRPNFEDIHVWSPILESNANILYVGSKSKEMKELEKRVGKRRFEFVSERFATAIEKF